ncbi:MAG: PDZ domain-containing protein [bacterium]
MKKSPRRRFFERMFLVFVVAFIVMSLWSHSRYAPPEGVVPEAFEKTYVPTALIADLDYMFATFEAVHPDLYFYTPAETLLALKNRLATILDQPMTRKEFYPVVARLAAAVGDGHTVAIAPREEIGHDSDQGGLWFPFEPGNFSERGLQVETIYLENCPIRPGDWITAVNGIRWIPCFRYFG